MKSNEISDHRDEAQVADVGDQDRMMADGRTFFRTHTGQATTYSPTSFSMDGHQKRCLMTNKDQPLPGWQE